MPVVNTVLHVHEANGSADSDTSAGEMIDTYVEKLGTPLCVAFVGHDNLVSASHPNPDVMTMAGIENEVRTEPTRLHLCVYPGHDFSVLAHPRETWPENTLSNAVSAAEEYGVDAIEKYNSATVQYEGRSTLLEVAGDDAHSPVGVGMSWLRVDAEDATPESVVSAIKRGDFEMVFEPSAVSDLVHQFDKSALLAGYILRGEIPLRRFL